MLPLGAGGVSSAHLANAQTTTKLFAGYSTLYGSKANDNITLGRALALGQSDASDNKLHDKSATAGGVGYFGDGTFYGDNALLDDPCPPTCNECGYASEKHICPGCGHDNGLYIYT